MVSTEADLEKKKSDEALHRDLAAEQLSALEDTSGLKKVDEEEEDEEMDLAACEGGL